MAVIAVVQHRVKDYPGWREIYDGFADLRLPHVGTSQGVYRATDDPNNVLVIHRFATAADAGVFLDAAYLRDVMDRAGVEGQPRIELYEDASG
jgi:hypothetical protein